MPTIPGVSATTTVTTERPIGTSGKKLAMVGGADQSLIGVATPFEFTSYSQAASALSETTVNGRLIDMIFYAFQNGAETVVACVASASATPVSTEYEDALAALLLTDGLDAVVVEDTSEAVALLLETHVNSAVADDKYRRGYCGLPTGSITTTPFTTRAAAIDNGRIFVVGPNLLDSAGVVVPGGITAAAAAMVAENEPDPAKPVSSVSIQGFTGVEKVFLNSEYDTLHNGGVFTTTARNGNISIMRYLTSYISAAGADVKEGTHAKTRDFVMTKMKTSLENKFRRAKVTNATLKQIENEIKGMIVLWKGQEIVNPDKSSSVSATINSTDPSRVDVNVSYYAVYPMNFINISINLNL
jgi:hypothetical protein